MVKNPKDGVITEATTRLDGSCHLKPTVDTKTAPRTCSADAYAARGRKKEKKEEKN